MDSVVSKLRRKDTHSWWQLVGDAPCLPMEHHPRVASQEATLGGAPWEADSCLLECIPFRTELNMQENKITKVVSFIKRH